MEAHYPIDELWLRLLNDDSWEKDPAVRMAIVQSMRIDYVGCPLQVG